MKTFLKEFRHTLEGASARLQKLSDEQSRIPKTSGKWSAKQIIGHLVDSAGNNHQRFVRAQFKGDLVFPGYEQEAWVKAQNYETENWRELIQLWKSYNLHIIHVVENIPADILKQKRVKHNLHQIAWKTIPEQEPATLEYFIRDYVGHLMNHLEQIWSQYKI
ncbi:DinB family protein [bacterium]|nr:MAG: DinB family protein [bacterium]